MFLANGNIFVDVFKSLIFYFVSLSNTSSSILISIAEMIQSKSFLFASEFLPRCHLLSPKTAFRVSVLNYDS